MIDDMKLFSINDLRQLWSHMCTYVVPFAMIPDQYKEEIQRFYIDSALGLLSGTEVKPDPHPPIDIELNKDIELAKREEGENVG